MTIFQRLTQPFQKLISKLNKNDEVEATICDDLDPYMVGVVKSLNEHATENVAPMTRARNSHAA